MAVAMATMMMFGVFAYGLQWSAFSSDSDDDFLTAWLTPDSWRQSNKRDYVEDWGVQELEQVIITTADGQGFLPPNGDRSALLAAYELVQDLNDLKVVVNKEEVSLKDICFQPAAPVYPTCLQYNPFDWWANNRSLVASPNASEALSAVTVPGGIDGLKLKRFELFGGIVEDAPDRVENFYAMMVWFFVDASPEKRSIANYNESIDVWEDALLRTSLATNDNPLIPIKVDCAISTSKNDQINDAVLNDMDWIYGAIVAVFLLLGIVCVIMDSARWKLAVTLCGTLGISTLGQLGIIGWAAHLGLIIKFNGDLMLAFVTMTLGAHQRILTIRSHRVAAHDLRSVLKAREHVAAMILCPYFLLCAVFVSALLLSLIWTDTPAIKAYTVAAVAGLLCDMICMGTFGMVAIADRAETDIVPERKPLIIQREPSHETMKSARLEANINEPNESNVKFARHPLPKSIRIISWLVSIGCCSAVISLSGEVLLGGFKPVLPLHDLVPKSSYIYSWSLNYDRYWSQVPLPLDFPVQGIDQTDPRNGPLMMELGNAIKASPIINQSTFRHWYAGYRDFCLGNEGCNETLVNGYMTAESFGPVQLVTFLQIPEYQALAADFKLVNFEFANISKFGGETKLGAVATYSQQLTLPSNLHDLTEELQTIFANFGTPGQQLRVFAFTAAFPYFETWQPARDDLWNIVIVLVCASGVLGLFSLEIWTIIGMGLAVVTGLGAIFYFCFVGLNADLNLVTAAAIYMILPVLNQVLFPVAFAYSGLVGSLALTEDPIGGYFRNDILRVHVPASIAFLFVMGGGMTTFLGCDSPINISFLYLFEAIVWISCGLLFLALIPWVNALSACKDTLSNCFKKNQVGREYYLTA